MTYPCPDPDSGLAKRRACQIGGGGGGGAFEEHKIVCSVQHHTRIYAEISACCKNDIVA